MPRIARAVFPGLPHHVTQRGNHRERVFFSNGDHESYLSLLCEYTVKHDIEVIAYCLMTNHVHLVVVPSNAAALHRALKPLHARYAQRVNRMRNQNGHLWQGRYFSSTLDAKFVSAAIRYVELNPVRAGMVERAEEYGWSSAAAHCGLRGDRALSRSGRWAAGLPSVRQWSAWLAMGDDPEKLDTLRLHAGKNLPCGDSSFIESLESCCGRNLTFRPAGGQRKSNDACKGEPAAISSSASHVTGRKVAKARRHGSA
ncbi:MAG: transposase [Steroidobacteraceae bacterium]